MKEISVLLKDKYSLVHVPYERKVRRWALLTRSHIRTGQSPENAGLLAARATFPYEFKEHNVYDSTPVEELIRRYDAT